jgi:hypothetical protein
MSKEEKPYNSLSLPRDPSERPTEDDLAQAALGGPRGTPELKPAKMTEQRLKKTPRGNEPGHTA